jgi:hypothetical protein
MSMEAEDPPVLLDSRMMPSQETARSAVMGRRLAASRLSMVMGAWVLGWLSAAEA